MRLEIKKIMIDHQNLSNQILNDDDMIKLIMDTIQMVHESLENKAAIYFCGNGGSAADAQHLAAELSGRFYLDRAPINAEALHVNSSYLTAVANDIGFEDVFARALEAKAKPGDILVAMSTSGKSENILKVLEKGKSMNLKIIGMTGHAAKSWESLCDYLIQIPSQDTPRIQEMHIMIGHIICQKVEALMFEEEENESLLDSIS